MRILFINNYYSPCRYGWGYRQLCEEVVDGLSEWGHDVAVLTSTDIHGEEVERPYPVHRLLQIEPDWENGKFAAMQFFMGRKEREMVAIATLSRLIGEFRPDLIFAWHTIGIPRKIIQEAQRLMDGRIAFYFADYQPELKDEYMAYWLGTPDNPIARALKKPVANLALNKLAKEGKPVNIDYANVACVSGYVRDRLVSQKLISDEAVVIHNGVNLDDFVGNGRIRFQNNNGTINCLVAGRMAALKGVHTVVKGLGLLTKHRPNHRLRLTLLGGGEAAYMRKLHQQVKQYGLTNIVTFRDSVPRSEMPEILNKHDVLVLSSEYDEPLARASQEGMAMGLMVIGTLTGGSGELLVHDETGLVFEAGNAASLAEQFARLLDEPGLAAQLAQNGYQAIQDHFNMGRMVVEVEAYLRKLLRKREVV
ncbi:MAG: glycosyltransferase family 4 protein [Chloroflexi bacterium]|nr:glycosyltransferase family 4 protein [Chloroflexota bacterium]